MAGFVNVGGVWKPAKPLKCNVGGVWKTIQQGYGNIGGVQKPLFTNTLVFSNFTDTSVFTATRSLSLSGRDTPTDKERSYILRAEASRLYVMYDRSGDSTRGSIIIKTVSPIDFTGYNKVVLASGHVHEINCDYEDDGSPMSAWRAVSVAMGILAPGSTVYTKHVSKAASAKYQSGKTEDFTNLTLDVSGVTGSYYLQLALNLYANWHGSGKIEGYATGPITIS